MKIWTVIFITPTHPTLSGTIFIKIVLKLGESQTFKTCYWGHYDLFSRKKRKLLGTEGVMSSNMPVQIASIVCVRSWKRRTSLPILHLVCINLCFAVAIQKLRCATYKIESVCELLYRAQNTSTAPWHTNFTSCSGRKWQFSVSVSCCISISESFAARKTNK